MDGRLIVASADGAFADLVIAQVANLGARAEQLDVVAARSCIDETQAMVVDLVVEGADALALEALGRPDLAVLVVGATAQEVPRWTTRRGASALAEPFSIAELVDSLRDLLGTARQGADDTNVIDLRARVEQEAPWWATR